MRSFEDIRAHLGARFALTASDPYQISFDLDIDDDRRQGIFLGDLETEGGRRYLRISTPIAPLAKSDAKRSLRFNWEQRVGYLAVNDLDGVPYLHLCENRPYDGLEATEIDALVEEIGRLADSLERLINEGADAV